jgi:hypothetical protein
MILRHGAHGARCRTSGVAAGLGLASNLHGFFPNRRDQYTEASVYTEGEFFAAKISEWVPSLIKQLMFFSGIFCGIVNQVPDFFSSEINRRRASLFLGKTRGISFLFEV